MVRRYNKSRFTRTIVLFASLILAFLFCIFYPNNHYTAHAIDNETIDNIFEDLLERMEPVSTYSLDINKTAAVADYNNRTYNITLDASLYARAMEQKVDLVFVTDVSNSMLFPASLTTLNTEPFTSAEALQRFLESQQEDSVFYLISNHAPNYNDSTVQRVWFDNGHWFFFDAAKYILNGSSEARTIDGNIYDGLDHKIYLYTGSTDVILDGNIYESESDDEVRLDYLKNAITLSSKIIFSADKDARIGLVTFAKNVSTNATFYNKNDFGEYNSTDDGTLLAAVNNISTAGGTNQAAGLAAANDFWPQQDTGGRKRIVILITDGAPNSTNTQGDSVTWGDIEDAARVLRENTGADIYTIGLSVHNVAGAEQNLSSVATQSDYAFFADNGKEFAEAFFDIITTLTKTAYCNGGVTDTISPAFYPLKDDGTLITPGETYKGAVYTKNDDNSWTLTWENQVFPSSDGEQSSWKKTFTIKAREDFLGGNDLKTNRENNDSLTIASKCIDGGGSCTVFDEQFVHDFQSPKVNVKGLKIDNLQDEITVNVGDEVDPLTDIKSMYDELVFLPVVTDFDDESMNSGDFDSDYTEERERAIKLSELVPISDEDWENLISALTEDGESSSITTPYSAYGVDGGEIRITLKQTIADGEPGLSNGSHDTVVVGKSVEHYILEVSYLPNPADADSTAVGQETSATTSANTYTVHVEVKNPQTSDNIMPFIVFLSMGVAIGAGARLLRRRR